MSEDLWEYIRKPLDWSDEGIRLLEERLSGLREIFVNEARECREKGTLASLDEFVRELGAVRYHAVTARLSNAERVEILENILPLAERYDAFTRGLIQEVFDSCPSLGGLNDVVTEIGFESVLVPITSDGRPFFREVIDTVRMAPQLKALSMFLKEDRESMEERLVHIEQIHDALYEMNHYLKIAAPDYIHPLKINGELLER